MSADSIKKRAKRLSQLLPAHLAEHEDPAKLSACQELMARCHDYPNFHAVTNRQTQAPPTGVSIQRSPAQSDPAMQPAWWHSANPLPLSSGVLTYFDHEGLNESKSITYSIVDFGYDMNSSSPVTALLLGTTDGADIRLHEDADLRKRVCEMALTTSLRGKEAFVLPTMICLVIKDNGPVYFVCYEWARVGTVYGTVMLKTHLDWGIDLDALSRETTLNSYSRFLLRQVALGFKKADQTKPHFELISRATKERFMQTLIELRSCSELVFSLARPAGLNISLASESWLIDTLHDLARFDEMFSAISGNLRVNPPVQHKAETKVSGGLLQRIFKPHRKQASTQT